MLPQGTFSESQSRHVQAHRQAKQEEFKQKLDQEMRANLPPRRQVTPVLKLRVADEDVSALVTIWSGGEDVADSLKEGSCVSIYNASASGRRYDFRQLLSLPNTHNQFNFSFQ